MTFKEQAQLMNKAYWTHADLMEFFEIGKNKATGYKKKIRQYMQEQDMVFIDKRKLPFKAVKEALGIDENYIRSQARKEERK